MAGITDLGGGRYKLTVFIGRDADGRQRRVAKRVAAKGIKDARQQAAQWQAELAGVKVDRLRAPVSSVAAEWLALWKAGHPAPKTVAEYERIVRQHVDGTSLGARAVRDVKPGDLDVWYPTLRTARGGPLAPSSLRRVHAVVRQVFEHAERRGLIARSPADKVKLPRLAAPEGRYPTQEELEAVVTAAWSVSPVRARLLVFAAHTGLRRGELAAVRWSRLDVDAGELLVARAISEVGGRLYEKDTKAHQALAVSVTPDGLAVALAQMAWQQAEAGEALDDDPWLWSAEPPFDQPPPPWVLTSWMVAARKKAGVEHVRLHDLRHWHASALLTSGATMADVQRQLRHKTMATTMVYVHPSDAAARRRMVGQLPRLQLPHGGGRDEVQE